MSSGQHRGLVHGTQYITAETLQSVGLLHGSCHSESISVVTRTLRQDVADGAGGASPSLSDAGRACLTQSSNSSSTRSVSVS